MPILKIKLNKGINKRTNPTCGGHSARSSPRHRQPSGGNAAPGVRRALQTSPAGPGGGGPGRAPSPTGLSTSPRGWGSSAEAGELCPGAVRLSRGRAAFAPWLLMPLPLQQATAGHGPHFISGRLLDRRKGLVKAGSGGGPGYGTRKKRPGFVASPRPKPSPPLPPPLSPPLDSPERRALALYPPSSLQGLGSARRRGSRSSPSGPPRCPTSPLPSRAESPALLARSGTFNPVSRSRLILAPSQLQGGGEGSLPAGHPATPDGRRVAALGAPLSPPTGEAERNGACKTPLRPRTGP